MVADDQRVPLSDDEDARRDLGLPRLPFRAIEVHELDEVVGLDAPPSGNGTKILALPLEPRSARLGVPVRKLARQRLASRPEERFLEDGAHAPLDVGAEHHEPAPPLQQEEAVVCRELELRDREPAPPVEEVSRQHIGDRDVELELHDVLDGLGGNADLDRPG